MKNIEFENWAGSGAGGDRKVNGFYLRSFQKASIWRAGPGRFFVFLDFSMFSLDLQLRSFFLARFAHVVPTIFFELYSPLTVPILEGPAERNFI